MIAEAEGGGEGCWGRRRRRLSCGSCLLSAVTARAVVPMMAMRVVCVITLMEVDAGCLLGSTRRCQRRRRSITWPRGRRLSKV